MIRKTNAKPKYFVLTIRVEDEPYAHRHIATSQEQCLCGVEVPEAVQSVWNTPNAPYINQGKVTCPTCCKIWINS